MTPAEIGNIGERHVTAWLQAKNYQCNRNTALPGSTDIEADASQASLLVQVKTALSPALPADLSTEEQRAIVARANRSGKEEWLARLQINSQGALIGEISWAKLN